MTKLVTGLFAAAAALAASTLSAQAAGCDFSSQVHDAAIKTLTEIHEHMNTTYRPTQPSKSTRDYLADFCMV
jgi:hypothetical protein